MKKTIILVYISETSNEINPAIYYLKEYVRDKWDDIDFITKTYSQKENILKIVEEISCKQPLFVGFSTYVWNVKKTFQIIHKLKQKKREIPVIIGGAEASYKAKEILKTFEDIDIVVKEEAEETFSQLVDYFFFRKKNLSNIKGIVYKKLNSIIDTGQRPPLDLMKVKSPYRSNCIPGIYGKIITYETSRGCPFKCAYCSYNTGSYATTRFFPIQSVIKDITYILEKEPRKMNIVDDNFNIYELRAKKILSQIRLSVKRTIVTVFLRADIWKISEVFVRLLAHQNIFCTIGIQTLNHNTLIAANRTHNKMNLDYNIQLLEKHKVNYILQFIIGLPGDRYKDVKDMVDWAFKYSPHDIHMQTLRINPQTEYERKSKKFGITYNKHPPHTIYQTMTMSPVELAKSKLFVAYFKMIYQNKKTRTKLTSINVQTGIPVSQIIEQSIKEEVGKISHINTKKLINKYI